jgi:prepilin-type N-terminal cleavage/methylation domain-containing protein
MKLSALKYQKGLALRNSKGFTLIELLVVIGILAVLLSITLIAINPARQFAQANDTKRASDVNAILNAIGQYSADNKGNLTALNIPSGATPGTISNTGVNLCSSLVTQYLAALPVDPLTNNGTPVTVCTAAYNTNYTVVQSASDSRVTVCAPATEIQAQDICVTR